MPKRGPGAARFVGRSLRPSLVASLILLALACSDATPPDQTPAATYTMSLSVPELTIQAGTLAANMTVNLVRTNYRKNVTLSVENLPTGVTAAYLSAISGSVSQLELTAAANAPTGTFTNLLVRCVAPGFADRTAPLTLTVTPAPPPAYTLALRSPTLYSAQGGLSVGTTLDLLRTNFSGAVTLSVENLPAGVNAYISPESLVSGRSSILYLWSDANAPTGTFANLLVRGVAAGLTDRTVPLTLTITEAPFSLTLSSPSLSIAQGAATPTMMVNVDRRNFDGPVTLHVGWYGGDHDTMPPGVTVGFAPNPATGNSSELTLTVSAAAAPGVYDLYVFGDGANTAAAFCCAALTLTVTAAIETETPLSQWAVGATASTEYNSGEWSAMQATGAPNVTGCADDMRAWASSSEDGVDWLELTYAQPVRPSEIRIHEVWGVGSIVKVEVKDGAGAYQTVYTAQPTDPQTCPRILTIAVTGVTAKVSAIRVSVDQRVRLDWNEIDAVQLIGYR